jgi:hypothetical protein
VKEEDLEAFSKELLTIGEAFYEKRDKSQIAPEVVMIYFDALREHSLHDVLRALRAHVKTPTRCKFWPKPGDIEELISGSRATASLEAWTKVEAAVRRQGRYRSVVFDDALIHAVLDDMGGWSCVCEVATEKDMQFQRQEFCRRYEGMRSTRGFPAVLLGVLDAEALRMDMGMSPPTLIGNAAQAEAVFREGFLPGGKESLRLPVSALRERENKGEYSGKVRLLEGT